MTTTTGAGSTIHDEQAPSATTATSEATPGGPRRLNPVDGLFLRAQHLDQIQQYAGELTRLSGLAGGSGTVYGFELELTDADDGGTRVIASPGLAVAPNGRMLRSLSTLEVHLGVLELGVPGRFWVVEVVDADPVLSGHEPAFSSVCATSCGPGSTIQPWIDDAVMLRVRAETLPGWWGESSNRTRNQLANRWFERERVQGRPWLTPQQPNTPVPSFKDHDWHVPVPADAPTASAVPLGLLYHVQAWKLDVWAARRDRIGTPSEHGWLHHLSGRPWNVFIAQVLQFQDQVAAMGPTATLPQFLEQLPPGGFVEVAPPADSEITDSVTQRFGGSVLLERHSVSADEAVRAVMQAQHLDRVPLRNDESPAAVDIWVPSIQADLDDLKAQHYGWVAFTRGRRPQFEVDGRFVAAPDTDERGTPDSVEVRIVDAPSRRDRYATAIDATEGSEPFTEVRFGSSGWDLVPDVEGFKAIREALGQGKRVEMAASTSTPAREPLMVARARALASELDLTEGDQIAVFSIQQDAPDAIYVMVRP